MEKTTGKPPRHEGHLNAEVPRAAGVKRRRRNRHGKNQEKSPADTYQYTGNRLEVSFLEQAKSVEVGEGEGGEKDDGVGGKKTRKLLPEALVPPLDADHPPTATEDVSIAKEDWKQLCRIWNKLSSNKKSGSGSGWMTPTSIQLQSWPILLNSSSSSSASLGSDSNASSNSNNLITLAPTGSGKTLAYGIPLVLAAIRSMSSSSDNELDEAEDARPLSRLAGLVLVPTRELSLQVAAEITSAAQSVSRKHAHQAVVVSCHGGVDRQEQVNAMLQVKASDGLIVTATPGRLLDLLQPTLASSTSEVSLKIAMASAEQLRLRFAHVEYTVLDEADRLAVSADLFQQVDSILALCTSRQTTCLCSATWPEKVKEKWREWLGPGPCAVVKVNAMTLTKAASSTTTTDEATPGNDDNNSETAAVASQDQASSRVNDWMTKIPTHLTQTLHVCSEHKKPRKLVVTLQKLRKENKMKNARQQPLGIIFFSKIKTLQYMSKLLVNDGFYGQELHSHLPQRDREQAVQRFQCGQTPLLLATDIAARGIHVNNIHFVINYDFPGNLEQYVHRCGRAGRGVGAEAAHVFSFFTRNMAPMAADVIRLLEANDQWVDQNLRDLVVTSSHHSPGPNKAKRRKKEEPEVSQDKDVKEDVQEDAKGSVQEDAKEVVQEGANRDDGNEASSDEEDLLETFGLESLKKRIVLKRADNVSDASDESDDDNDKIDH
jgi:ATP-dependent RNA helicase DDX5/DBP2